jgi:hypothetical protein
MELESIKELVSVVTKHKVKDISILRPNGTSKSNKLYNLLSQSSDVSEDQLIKNLGYETNPTAFNKLLYRLKSKLFNTLFFIDLNKASYTEYQKAYYSAYREWAAIKILTGKGAKVSALTYSKNLLYVAKKYDFTDIALNCSLIIKDYYSIIQLDYKKYLEFKDISEEYLTKLNDEVYAEDLIQQYRLHNFKFSRKNINYSTFYKKEIDNVLYKLSNNDTSYRFKYFIYIFLYSIYDGDNNLDKALQVAKNAHTFISNSSINNLNAEYLFLKNIIICYLRLCKYDNINILFKNSFDILNSESLNYYYNGVLYLIFLLRVGDFRKATNFYIKIFSTKQFKSLPKLYLEYYNIIASYISICDKNFNNSVGRQFSSSKFINEVPIFSKEKSRTNISILIAHFILLIISRKYSQAIERVDALNQYTYRYLRKDSTYRSNCFIKILIEITKANFNKKRALRYTKPLLTKLSKISQKEAKQPIDVEYVNYHSLFNIIINYLD